tara:strand:+ start:1210 stop:1731 length:522 start_codon:yes stop_codon:yes gene_type:complete
MQKLLILCALEKELPVRENPYSSITVYTGVGKVNAAMMAAFSIKSRRPDMIINYGTAGSCNKKLSGLVECGNFIDRDDSGAFNEDTIITTDYNKCVISTGDNFVTKELNFCDLVDMESYAIAKVCKKTKTEFKCYKYITDYVNSSSMNDWEEKIGDGYELFLEQIDDYIKNSV